MSKSAPHAPASESLPALPRFDTPLCTTRPDLPWADGDLGHPMVREAMSVCSGCRHLIPCRDFALGNREVAGIWGSLTPAQRQSMWRASDVRNHAADWRAAR